ncbi:MAG: GDP-mannose 4,6-dehydratase [bacterium]|nr:GDP-mannose 4,6-dehydratase [bacterium]
MKKALITGIRGQDGAYLAKLLLDLGYQVYGADRRSSDSSYWRLEYLKIKDKIKLVYMDLLEYSNIIDVIKEIKPDEVYNLAAQSFVQVSFNQPLLTSEVNALGVLRLLEALKLYKPDAKFYQASTSEMFGIVKEVPQNENTPFNPVSPYAVSKVFAHYITVNYRLAYNMFNCCGILFNHESPLRGLEFVTKKIVNTAVKIKYNLAEKLLIGNIYAKRDWGYAPEYIYGMYLMLNHDKPDDYVLATNETHTVKEFIDKTFEYLGMPLKWEEDNDKIRAYSQGKLLVESSLEFYRPSEVPILKGDYTKAKKILNWEPTTKFDKLIEIMINEEFNIIKLINV